MWSGVVWYYTERMLEGESGFPEKCAGKLMTRNLGGYPYYHRFAPYTY